MADNFGIGSGGARNISQFSIMSWNVEGLTELKEMEIVAYMTRFEIDVCCLQETRKTKSDVYMSHGSYFILSGSAQNSTEWYGVGFVVSRRFRHLVRGFCQQSERIASLKIKCNAGSLAIFAVLAPHNLRPPDEKWKFYEELGVAISKTSVNGPKFLFGDFNARIGQPRPGEQSVIGPHCFGVEAQHRVEMPNRDFLLEFCTAHDLAVANTFCNRPDDPKVTYREPGVPALAPICANKFTMLDLLLTSQRDLNAVRSVFSDRLAPLASSHFPVTAILHVDVAFHNHVRKKTLHVDWSALQEPILRRTFSDHISSKLNPDAIVDVNHFWDCACSSVAAALLQYVPVESTKVNKPWISSRTLDLLNQRREARVNGNWNVEKQLQKEVKKSAKKDRSNWLEDLASSGDWKSIKKLRRGRIVKQGRLKNTDGEFVSSELRAETLAEHLEKVQWRIRPTTLIPEQRPNLGDVFHVSRSDFNHTELRKAISKMASGKATKTDDIPVEVFKFLAMEPNSSLQWLLDLCNHCWRATVVPDEWSTASVAMLFKKGDPADPNNYRPICLQSIAYKLFASLIKQRLLDAGVQNRLWKSQFGFRDGHCTEDAIFVALRKIEQACAQRSGQIRLLALDWKKAFDSINLDSLLDALRRFGIPDFCRQMIHNMMRHRRFYVEDQGSKSSLKSQNSGISQGCTLSPLLFIIVMTVLMHDAVSNLNGAALLAYNRGDLADIVYADDTLLLGTSDPHLQDYLSQIADAGLLYGMELHWDKFQLLQVQCQAIIRTPTGEHISPKLGIDYLGSVLSHDGLPGHELGRRIGMAKRDFLELQKVWKHSSLSRDRKIQIYKALIESKLMYSLSCLCLSSADRRRLDGFQNRCLRSILGIPPAFISRVPNAEVLRRACYPAATDMLLKRQLLLFGKVLRSAYDHPLHNSAFIRGTLQPATSMYVRRVGRPRREWVTFVRDKACQFLKSHREITRLVQNPHVWNHTVCQFTCPRAARRMTD